MANSYTFPKHVLVICAATILLLMTLPPKAIAGEGIEMGMGMGLFSKKSSSTSCSKGSIGDCMLEEEQEFEMDSEINRRILATTKYIGYGALQRDTVPCSRRGASYYNCQPGAQANPYTRGCSAIARCRT